MQLKRGMPHRCHVACARLLACCCCCSGELGSSVSNTLSTLLTEKSPSTGQLVRQKLIYGHILNLMVAGEAAHSTP